MQRRAAFLGSSPLKATTSPIESPLGSTTSQTPLCHPRLLCSALSSRLLVARVLTKMLKCPQESASKSSGQAKGQTQWKFLPF